MKQLIYLIIFILAITCVSANIINCDNTANNMIAKIHLTTTCLTKNADYNCTSFDDNYYARINNIDYPMLLSHITNVNLILEERNEDIQYATITLSATGQYQVANIYGIGTFTSADSGHTWKKTSNQYKNYYTKICISDNGQYAVSNFNGVQVSNDYGQTWSRKDAYNYGSQSYQYTGCSPEIGSCRGYFVRPLIHMGGGQGVDISSDGKYMYASDFGGGQFGSFSWRSQNYGAGWDNLGLDFGNSGSDAHWVGIESSCDGKNVVAVNNGYYRGFEIINAGKINEQIINAPNGIATKGDVYVSENYGQISRRIAELGQRTWDYLSVSCDGQTIIVGGYKSPELATDPDVDIYREYKSTDAGRTWIETPRDSPTNVLTGKVVLDTHNYTILDYPLFWIIVIITALVVGYFILRKKKGKRK